MSAPTTRKVPYVRLGNSGIKVSKVILGCMQYGNKDWEQWVIDDEEEAFKHIKFAYDAGIQTFDTADIYSNGLSEVILGKAIKKLELPRQEIVVMTKLFGAVDKEYGSGILRTGTDVDTIGFDNQHGLGRKHIFEGVKASLERLQLDYIDVLQSIDLIPKRQLPKRSAFSSPSSRIIRGSCYLKMQALHDVVQAGFVRYLGMSSCWAWQFHAMQNYAIQNKLTPFISMQNHHNLLYREEEREMLPTLKLFGVGAIPWSPLARGLLTRPLESETTRKGTDTYMIGSYLASSGTPEIVKRVEEIAKKRGISMAQVAFAWSASKEGITAPIVGTTSLKNLEELVEAVNVKLTEDEMKYLEEPYKAQPVIGHS